MAITKADIWRIADELDGEGINPTLAAVRKRLGSGSFTTISDAMSDWKARKQATPTLAPENAPTAVLDALTEVAGSIWGIAIAAAEKRLEDERQRLADEHEEITARASEAAELADSLTQENEALQTKLAGYDELRRERDRFEDQFNDLKKRSGDELMRTMERIKKHDADATEARKEARAAIEEAATLRGQVEAYKEQLAALQAASVRGKAAKD